MCRQSIHLDKHLKRLKQLWILKLSWRRSEVSGIILLYKNKNIRIIFHFFQKRFHIFFRHPTTQNIKVLMLIFYTSRNLSDIEVLTEHLKPVSRLQKTSGLLCQRQLDLVINPINLCCDLLNLSLQLLIGFLCISLIFIRQINPFKMQRLEDRIGLIGCLIRYKIHSVHIAVIFPAFNEQCIHVTVHIFFKAMIIIHRNPSEPKLNIAELKNIVQVKIQRTERCKCKQTFS